MQLDGPNNQTGGDNPINPDQGVPGAEGGQDVSRSPGKTMGGLRDIFNKHSKTFKDYDQSKKSNGVGDIFKKGPKQAAKDYAYNKGKDYLKNTETGKKITSKGVMKIL